jgi:hypothetical protein
MHRKGYTVPVAVTAGIEPRSITRIMHRKNLFTRTSCGAMPKSREIGVNGFLALYNYIESQWHREPRSIGAHFMHRKLESQ